MANYTIYSKTEQKQYETEASKQTSSYSFESQKNVFNTDVVPQNLTSADAEQKLKSETKNINYYMQYSNLYTNIELMHSELGLKDDGAQKAFITSTKRYNRFKLPTRDDAFQKGFAHVFFTRPDCNIISGGKLNDSFINNPEFYYAYRNSPDMVKQLCIDNGQKHDFMLSLSNKAASFSLNDEYINSDTYGKTYAGWKIAFGRNNVESKTAGDFSIRYNDDRTLHVYHLHKLWVDYISGVYTGKYNPNLDYIKKKILDYAASCYYIVTAEDGETIIFWSKYYGVFPTTIPSTQYSWGYGNILGQSSAELDIKYEYSFKEDFNPASLIELNYNANIVSDISASTDINSIFSSSSKIKYIPTYDPKLGHTGASWVGVPFVELVTDYKNNNNEYISEAPYTFKLRFMEAQ